jgi:hypothetical protein
LPRAWRLAWPIPCLLIAGALPLLACTRDGD